jgi:uncharacterized protein (DUF2267 family)
MSTSPQKTQETPEALRALVASIASSRAEVASHRALRESSRAEHTLREALSAMEETLRDGAPAAFSPSLPRDLAKVLADGLAAKGWSVDLLPGGIPGCPFPSQDPNTSIVRVTWTDVEPEPPPPPPPPPRPSAMGRDSMASIRAMMEVETARRGPGGTR